ncbi:replication protein C, IncQ-type [Aeromonas hydrophila]|uniref:replication protein C, IncQ-type n=1 Tax=Aeromonas hydrophila TaxID=644 RepID=UPI0038D0C393
MKISKNNGHNIKNFALAAPFLGRVPRLFMPMPSGKRPINIILDAESGHEKLRVELAEGLDSSDQSVLLVLIALAGIDSKIISSANTGPKSSLLWNDLNVSFDAETEQCALVTTTQTDILKILGWNRSGHEYNRLKKCLNRLKNVSLLISKGERQWRSGLLSYLINNTSAIGGEDIVYVVLNSKIAKALDGGQYARICLEERRSLSSNIAQLLHTWLSFNINHGYHLSPYIDTLVQRIWGEPCKLHQSKSKTEYEKKEIRRKRAEIVTALKQLSELDGWRVRFNDKVGSNRQVEVKRLRVINGAVEKSNP